MVIYNGLYNPKYYGDKLTANHFSDKKLHFKIIENGTILPHISPGWNGSGGVFDCEGHFVYGTNYSIYGGGPYRLDEKINYESKTVIYAGMFTPEWGHCITDSLRRLWFLRSDIFKKYFKDCPIVYHLRHGGDS